MKSLYSTTAGVLLLALLVWGMASLAGQPLPGGATLRWLRQEMPPSTAPCLSASDHGFTFAFLGYRANDDGTHTLTYRVTNAGKHDVSHAAFGTAGWTRVEPAEGSAYHGELGDYQVEWTNNKGNPGFVSVKFTPQFGGFSAGASDAFTIVVRDFDPNASVQVQAKAGQDRGTVSLRLSDGPCDRTPPPAPVSPLPTPTPTPPATWRAEHIQLVLHPERSPQFPTEVTDMQFGGQIYDGRLLIIAQDLSKGQSFKDRDDRRTFVHNYGGWLWNSSTQQVDLLIDQIGMRKPALSPGGKHLVTTQLSVIDDQPFVQMLLLNLETGERHFLPDELVSTHHAWLGSSKLLIQKNSVWYLYDLEQNSAASLAITGIKPEHGIGEIWVSPYAPYFAAITAKDEAQHQLYLYIARWTGSGYEAYAGWPTTDQVTNFGWSPDGDYLAYKPWKGDVFLVNLLGPADVITAPSGSLVKTSLTWSPDSQVLLYGDNNPAYQQRDLRGERDPQKVNQAIFAINRDGSGWRQLTTYEDNIGFPNWYGDSNQALASTYASGVNRRVFAVEVDYQ